jgi:hypothetical protein
MRVPLLLAVLAGSLHGQQVIGPSRILGPSLIPVKTSSSVNWTLNQSVYKDTCTSASVTTCAVTVSSVPAGDLLEVWILNAANRTISSVAETGGTDTWVHCTAGTGGCHNFCGAGSVDMSYVISSGGGATTITTTISSADGSFYAALVLDFKRGSGTATFDDANVVTDSTNCTSCTGTSFTGMTGTQNVASQLFVGNGTISAISGSYTYVTNTDGVGMAYWLNATANTVPNWTQAPTNSGCGAGATFK